MRVCFYHRAKCPRALSVRIVSWVIPAPSSSLGTPVTGLWRSQEIATFSFLFPFLCLSCFLGDFLSSVSPTFCRVSCCYDPIPAFAELEETVGSPHSRTDAPLCLGAHPETQGLLYAGMWHRPAWAPGQRPVCTPPPLPGSLGAFGHPRAALSAGSLLPLWGPVSPLPKLGCFHLSLVPSHPLALISWVCGGSSDTGM